MNDLQLREPVAEPQPVFVKNQTIPPGASRKARAKAFFLSAALMVPVALAVGFVPRWRSQRDVIQETQRLAVPNVTVVSPELQQRTSGMPLPAELQAYTEAPIYARANGYLKRWLVDIGQSVKEGQLLAEIDTPELDQSVKQSRAEVDQAQAALDLAKSTAVRWDGLVKRAAVSEQEADEKNADLKLKTATLKSTQANLQRLEELQSFAKVVAPFDGVITARRTDVGQLIVAGNGQELFRLAKTDLLRVFVRVPQEQSRGIEPGQIAEITVPELPGRTFLAKVVRTAGAIDADSRTLLTELEVDNKHHDLLTGGYASVRFSQARDRETLVLPSNTLLFRAEGMQVGVVDAGEKVELRNVRLGRDFGQTVEVLEGIKPSDRAILNPSDSLSGGTQVRVVDASHVAR
jgi:RND family efflux transporter MFP subunit